MGQLALVEAFRGDLRRADARADLVLTTTHSPDGDGAVHARVAKAWIHLERDELVEARQCLDGVGEAWEWGHDPWLSMNRLLAEARLLMALRQPDAASRLLALDREFDTRLSTSGWIADLLATERADTLLAAGEPQRALAALTPLPRHTVVEATLVAAAARRDIGDFRGAQAVLNTVTSDLERSPLSLLIRAQLLEAALAQTRGQRPRARLLVDRALHSACLEEMRTPINREWRWLLSCVNQDPALARSHRSFLSTLDFGPTVAARRTPSPAPERLGGQALTERERQVLDLLALMCSTEESPGAVRVAQHRQDPPQRHLRQDGREPSGRRRTPWPPVGSLLTGSRPTGRRCRGPQFDFKRPSFAAGGEVSVLKLEQARNTTGPAAAHRTPQALGDVGVISPGGAGNRTLPSSALAISAGCDARWGLTCQRALEPRALALLGLARYCFDVGILRGLRSLAQCG